MKITSATFDFNDAELIRSRLADEGIEFPTVKEMYEIVEPIKPEVFNYFSIHGKIAYVRKFRSLYEVIVKNVDPRNFLDVDIIHFNRHNMAYTIQRTEIFELAIGWFSACVYEMTKRFGTYKHG